MAAGHKGRGEVHLRLSLHVAETDKEAQAQAHDSVMAGYQKLVSQLEGSPNARRRAELADVKSLTYDAVMRDKVVIGSPKRWRRDCPICRISWASTGYWRSLNFGAMIPPDQMMRSLQLLLQEVRPRLRAV